jgi:hypothetical protein
MWTGTSSGSAASAAGSAAAGSAGAGANGGDEMCQRATLLLQSLTVSAMLLIRFTHHFELKLRELVLLSAAASPVPAASATLPTVSENEATPAPSASASAAATIPRYSLFNCCEAVLGAASNCLLYPPLLSSSVTVMALALQYVQTQSAANGAAARAAAVASAEAAADSSSGGGSSEMNTSRVSDLHLPPLARLRMALDATAGPEEARSAAAAAASASASASASSTALALSGDSVSDRLNDVDYVLRHGYESLTSRTFLHPIIVCGVVPTVLSHFSSCSLEENSSQLALRLMQLLMVLAQTPKGAHLLRTHSFTLYVCNHAVLRPSSAAASASANSTSASSLPNHSSSSNSVLSSRLSAFAFGSATPTSASSTSTSSFFSSSASSSLPSSLAFASNAWTARELQSAESLPALDSLSMTPAATSSSTPSSLSSAAVMSSGSPQHLSEVFRAYRSSDGLRNVWHRTWCAVLGALSSMCRSCAPHPSAVEQALDVVRVFDTQLMQALSVQPPVTLTLGRLEEIEHVANLFYEVTHNQEAIVALCSLCHTYVVLLLTIHLCVVMCCVVCSWRGMALRGTTAFRRPPQRIAAP